MAYYERPLTKDAAMIQYLVNIAAQYPLQTAVALYFGTVGTLVAKFNHTERKLHPHK